MKEYILKRERVFHLLALAIVIASVFVQDMPTKIAMLVLGILGLIAVSYAKGNKTSMIIYILLLIIAGVGYYLISNDLITLPTY